MVCGQASVSYISYCCFSSTTQVVVCGQASVSYILRTVQYRITVVVVCGQASVSYITSFPKSPTVGQKRRLKPHKNGGFRPKFGR